MAFLVFEGIDGAGKSSLIRSMENWLQLKSIPYLTTREPGGTKLGDELREILLRTQGESPVPKTELLIYQAGRAQHVEKKIQPALNNGHWVLCDRYTASSVAFQSGGRGLDASDIHWLNHFSTSGLEPALQILLDLPVSTSLQRIDNRTQKTSVEKDRFELEKADFHERVRQAYLSLARATPSQWLVLDASLPTEKLFETVQKTILAFAWGKVLQ
jgi:dTMP kinase